MNTTMQQDMQDNIYQEDMYYEAPEFDDISVAYNNDKNFDRIDGRSSFLCGTRNGLQLQNGRTSQGKIALDFVDYDKSNGNKAKATGTFYLSFHVFEKLRLRFMRLTLKPEYAGMLLFQCYAGTKDGSRSRIFEVSAGQKSGMLQVQYKEGPGRPTKTGAVMSTGKPDTVISVPCEMGDFMAMLELGHLEIANARLEQKIEKLEATVNIIKDIVVDLHRKCS